MDMLRKINDKRTHCFLSSLSKMAFFREPNDAMAAPSYGIRRDLVTPKAPSLLLFESDRGPNNNDFGPLTGLSFTTLHWPKLHERMDLTQIWSNII